MQHSADHVERLLDISWFVDTLMKRLDETMKSGHENPHGSWEENQPHAGSRGKQP